MSQRDVERILGRLATDQHWRHSFRPAPAETVDAMSAALGLDVTPVERRALISLPADALDAFAASLDQRLQRVEAPR